MGLSFKTTMLKFNEFNVLNIIEIKNKKVFL